MAITRAQQAKQLLAQGGRIGLANGAQFDTSKGGGPISPGTSIGGNTRGGTGKGRDLDVQQRGMTKSEYNRRAAEGTIDRYKGPDGPPKPPQLQEDKRFIPTPVPKGIGFLDRTRNKLIQASLNRDKVLALKRLGLIKDPGFTGFVGTTIDALTGKIPEQFEFMSEKDLLDIATSGPYLSTQKTKGDVNKFSSGKDLLGRVFEAEDLLRKGDMTQTKYDELFPGPNIPEEIGGEGGIQDPCKGPNPPAYCFIGQNADDNMEAATVFQPNFRTMADGGMTEDAPVEGGIMDLETGRQMYFLGKLVKKATRAVKKIVKSPIGMAGLGFLAMQNPAISGFLKKKAMPFLFEGGKFSGGLTGGGKLALGGALTLAPFLFGQEEEEQKQPMYAGADLPYPVDYYLSGNFPVNRRLSADGGIMRTNYQEGGDAEPVAKKTMPLIDMDGKEKDYRETGGFVDMGRMERADDVPARLSKNEFVFTADAVRNAGEGDIDKGAEVMYNMMKNLEAGGEVSEESQGLEGARKMFQTSQRLEEVL